MASPPQKHGQRLREWQPGVLAEQQKAELLRYGVPAITYFIIKGGRKIRKKKIRLNFTVKSKNLRGVVVFDICPGGTIIDVAVRGGSLRKGAPSGSAADRKGMR